MILINARLSERSFGRWRLVPSVIAALLRRFDLCLTQSGSDTQRYAELGAPHITCVGNLKLDVPAPPVDQATLRKLKSIIDARTVVAAASTHAGEETAVIASHRRLRAKYPSLLTIIAPRHPDRGSSIADIAKVAGLSVALRSRGELPKPDVDIFVADTLGELGLIYRLAPIVFMGGSLVSHGGQNPIEAIRLGAAVVHGPHVWNFAEIYGTLDAAHGAELIADEEALTTCLAGWLANRGGAQSRSRCGHGDGTAIKRSARTHSRRARALSDTASARTAGVIEPGMICSENRYPTPIKSGAGFFGIMR